MKTNRILLALTLILSAAGQTMAVLEPVELAQKRWAMDHARRVWLDKDHDTEKDLFAAPENQIRARLRAASGSFRAFAEARESYYSSLLARIQEVVEQLQKTSAKAEHGQARDAIRQRLALLHMAQQEITDQLPARDPDNPADLILTTELSKARDTADALRGKLSRELDVIAELEAGDASRERARRELGEAYRSLYHSIQTEKQLAAADAGLQSQYYRALENCLDKHLKAEHAARESASNKKATAGAAPKSARK